ncbi:unnamed protein product [Rotaria sp. Silwood1]|nr:unnamed protein product [Rotaria sp. Silwood1]CAF3500252.1 unnamed protein product [Rotaria sp. Silwood1]CAF4688093.1 unnamed protein product [Rotaria sp. Silwood1]CAF4784055.1 unnamed protein product [Rotaria sp. Silwood1]
MVRSRSETNLNRIFIDLCTSPAVRNKFGDQRNNQRQCPSPLPSLKPIKSNSCSNIDELSQQISSSLPIENNQKEQKNTVDQATVQQVPVLGNQSVESSGAATPSLAPMESTGFSVQTTSFPNHHSLTLFETLSISHLRHPSLHRETSKETKTKISPVPSNSSTASRDLKHQDFLNRLQDHANNIQHGYQRSPSDEIIALTYNGNTSLENNTYTNNTYNVASNLSRQMTLDSRTGACSTLSQLSSYTDDSQLDKPRKPRSLMSSFRNSILHRRKKHHKKDQQNEHPEISPLNSTIETRVIPHSVSAEPCLSISSTDTIKSNRHPSLYRSFRNIFRSKSKKQTLDTSNVIMERPDSLSTLTSTPKKRPFFRRFKSEKKQQQTNQSANSLTSDDCTRSESARNTPIRANVGRPVTMTKPPVQ